MYRKALALCALLVAVATTAAAVVGTAGGASKPRLEQVQKAGWDCNPPILLLGHYHCSPPGKPSVADVIAGTDVPSIVHQVFRPDGSFAGTEHLIRADLYAGQPCPQDQWLPVPPAGPVQYYACHHFAIST
jgi:hypothetical protein